MSDFLEKQVEALIVSAFQNAVGNLCTVYGIWQDAPTGEVKETEASHISVATSIGANTSQNSRIIHITSAIIVRVAYEDSPDGSKLTEFVSPIALLLREWNKDCDVMSTALSVSTVFSADGIMIDDAGLPDFDYTNKVWFCPMQIKIAGTLPAS